MLHIDPHYISDDHIGGAYTCIYYGLFMWFPNVYDCFYVKKNV